jgi:excinuclease ABC subunit C
LRSKSQIKSELDNIKGIGAKTASTLLRQFKSVKRIKEASLQEVATVIGMAKAQIVKKGLEETK